MQLNKLLKSAYEWKEDASSTSDTISFLFTTVREDIVKVRFVQDCEYLGSFDELYWIEFSRNNEYNITGGGDAYKIFATVLEIIDYFIDEYHPKVLALTSDENSRSSLYARMFKTLASKYSANYVSLADAKFIGRFHRSERPSAREEFENSFLYNTAEDLVHLYSCDGLLFRALDINPIYYQANKRAILYFDKESNEVSVVSEGKRYSFVDQKFVCQK